MSPPPGTTPCVLLTGTVLRRGVIRRTERLAPIIPAITIRKPESFELLPGVEVEVDGGVTPGFPVAARTPPAGVGVGVGVGHVPSTHCWFTPGVGVGVGGGGVGVGVGAAQSVSRLTGSLNQGPTDSRRRRPRLVPGPRFALMMTVVDASATWNVPPMPATVVAQREVEVADLGV